MWLGLLFSLTAALLPCHPHIAPLDSLQFGKLHFGQTV